MKLRKSLRKKSRTKRRPKSRTKRRPKSRTKRRPKSRTKRRSIKKGLKTCNPEHKNASNPLYMCNPGSGRWILKSGSTGKKLLGHVQRKSKKIVRRKSKKIVRRKSIKFKIKKNANHPDYILNPKSKNWVLKKGPTGRKIQRDLYEKNKYKCSVEKPLSQYSKYDLQVKCIHGCKIPYTTSTLDTKMLYNLILWHSGKCANEYSIMGDPVQEIEKGKLIRLNDSCYDIDNLVQTLIANGDQNRDIYSAEKKLWTSQSDKDLIIKHPGLKYDIKITYKKMIHKIEVENRKLMISDPKAPDIINTIMEVGWIAYNDNPSSHDHDPEKFQISQLAIANLFNTINELPNKEQWNAFSFNGLRLGTILNSLANTCIHGIGSNLIKLGYYMFLSSFELGIMIKLPDIFTVLDNGIRYPQFYEEYYKKDKIEGNTVGRIITVDTEGKWTINRVSKFSKKDVQNMENIYKKWDKIKKAEKDIIKIRTTVPKRAISSKILYYIKEGDLKGLLQEKKNNFLKYRKLNGDAFLASVLNSKRYNSQTVAMVDTIINTFKMSKKSEFINRILEKMVIAKRINRDVSKILEMFLENDFSVDATSFEIAQNKKELVKKILEYVPMTTKVLGYLKKMKDISKACSNPEDNILFEPWDNDSDLIIFDNMGSYCLDRSSIEQFWKSNDQSYEQDIAYSLGHDGDPNPSKKVYAVYTPGIVYVDEKGKDLLKSQKHITYSLVHPKEFILIKKGALPVSSDIYQVYPRDNVNDYK